MGTHGTLIITMWFFSNESQNIQNSYLLAYKEHFLNKWKNHWMNESMNLKRSVFTPNWKTGSAKQHSNYRTVVLTFQASKMLPIAINYISNSKCKEIWACTFCFSAVCSWEIIGKDIEWVNPSICQSQQLLKRLT